MANDGQKLQKVGVIKTGGQIVNVLYVGGSMFMLDFQSEAGKKPAMIDKSRVDMLIEKNQLKLTSEDTYRRICENIDPVTGETQEHHADGTKKTEVERVLHQLNEERSTKSDREERAPRQPEHGRPVQPRDEAFGNEVAGIPDPTAAHSMTRRRPRPSSQDLSQEDIFGDGGGTPAATTSPSNDFSDFSFDNQAPSKAPATGIPGGPDGGMVPEGVPEPEHRAIDMGRQDKENSLKTPPSKRRLMLVGTGAVSILGCLLCFGLTSSVIRGMNLRVSEIPLIGQFLSPAEDRRDLPINEQVKAGETESTTPTTSGMEVVVRNDFDPESPVMQFALADDKSKDVAIKFFQAIRIFYSEGNLDQLNSMIAYDNVHDQISNAYATIEQQRLGLSEDARNTLQFQYKTILNQQEGNHIANHDLDASMYCGRIREVRVDDSDGNRMYVVMESLAGDHQRACYVLQGDVSTGMYAVTGMVDPEGYVRMIMAGAI